MAKPVKGKFLKIICPRCKTHQLIFGKSSLRVKCSKCGWLLIKTGGGKVKVRALVKEVLTA